MFIFLVFSLLSLSDSLPTSTVVPSSEFQYTPIGQAASWSDNRISGKTSSLSFYDHRSTINTGRITVPDKHFNKSLASSSTVPLLRVNKKNTSNTKYSEENETVSASSENGIRGPDIKIPFLKLDRDYSPKEIAQYIFTTGDEAGFVQGVSEMVEDGQIMESKDDVILFLELVRKELADLRNTRSNRIKLPLSS